MKCFICSVDWPAIDPEKDESVLGITQEVEVRFIKVYICMLLLE